jgi:uncharacterized SAM-binding protein YcdF (DUF218 family)
MDSQDAVMQVVRRIVKFLVLPPTGFLLLIAAGWLISRRWRRPGHLVMGLGLILLYLVSTPLVASALLRGHQVYPALDAGSLDRGAGAIVVLSGDLRRGAPEYGGDTVGALTLQRLRYGAKLHRETALPVLVTGGILKNASVSVAEVMQRTLRADFNVPTAWIETASQTTYENAKFSLEILQAAGIRRVYLVTHAWHMPRAKSVFEAVGLEVVPAPTAFLSQTPFEPGDLLPSARGLVMGYFAIYEWLARAWYALAYGKR